MKKQKTKQEAQSHKPVSTFFLPLYGLMCFSHCFSVPLFPPSYDCLPNADYILYLKSGECVEGNAEVINNMIWMFYSMHT